MFLQILSLTLFLCLFLTVSAIFDISSKDVIPPAKRRSIVTYKCHVVVIMMISACPKWNEVTKRPRKIVSGVAIDGLTQATDDPEEHSEEMELPRSISMNKEFLEGMVDQWSANGTEAKNRCFKRMSVLSSNTKWSSIFVMDLVNTFVEWWPVH